MDKHPCRVAEAEPRACRRRIAIRFLMCSRCWRLIPRPERDAIQAAYRAHGKAGELGERALLLAEWRRLVAAAVAGIVGARMSYRPVREWKQKAKPKEFVEPESKRYADGVRECPRCNGHKHTAEFVLLEPGDRDPRPEAFYQGAKLVESLVWFVYPKCTLCDAKGIVSVSRAAHWVKCQEARR